LTVRTGEVHGLMGANGAGKTTLIDAVTGFVRAAQGDVLLSGQSINGWSAPRRAREGLARSFQSVELFSDLTVLENIAVASDRVRGHHYVTSLVRPGKARISEAALRACEEFDLLHHFGQLPGQLSFGDRRLVSIARAIAPEPKVLLLDEPAAGLDSVAVSELGRVIRWLAREAGIAVVLVEHNLEMLLATSDEVTVIDRGATIYSGTPEGVRSDQLVVDAYIGEEDPKWATH